MQRFIVMQVRHWYSNLLMKYVCFCVVVHKSACQKCSTQTAESATYVVASSSAFQRALANSACRKCSTQTVESVTYVVASPLLRHHVVRFCAPTDRRASNLRGSVALAPLPYCPRLVAPGRLVIQRLHRTLATHAVLVIVQLLARTSFSAAP